MAGKLLSELTGYTATEFDTKVPDLTDPANIQEAFKLYHYGIDNYAGATEPAANSIHGHIKSLKTLLEGISASAVVTLSGTINEITVSASTGYVTIGLPDDVTIGDDLIVTDDLTVGGDILTTGSSVLKGGVNIYSNSGARDASITSPTEGVVAFLTGTDEFTVYNGSSWVGIENHGTLGGRIDNTEVLALLGL